MLYMKYLTTQRVAFIPLLPSFSFTIFLWFLFPKLTSDFYTTNTLTLNQQIILHNESELVAAASVGKLFTLAPKLIVKNNLHLFWRLLCRCL